MVTVFSIIVGMIAGYIWYNYEGSQEIVKWLYVVVGLFLLFTPSARDFLGWKREEEKALLYFLAWAASLACAWGMVQFLYV